MKLTEKRYIFDTTVFIDYLRKKPIARQLFYQARFNNVEVYYSVLTEAELWAGIKGLWTVKEHEAVLRPFKRSFVNVTIARRAGNLRSKLPAGGKLPSIADCIIAATGEYLGIPICSSNSRDFSLFTDLAVPYQAYKS